MWERDTYWTLAKEFFWLMRHGEFNTCWQWRINHIARETQVVYFDIYPDDR